MNDFNDDDQGIINDVVKMCHKRFGLASEAEAEGRQERRKDIRFLRLREQWPEYAQRGRNIPGRERPMLVVNRLLQFRNQVANEIRMNSPSIRVRPVDDKADVKTAEVFEGIIRHIMSISGGNAAIDIAAEWQIDTGVGYIAVEPDYIDPDSWDQELYINQCEDPFKWWLDPNSKKADGSDLEWAIYALDMKKEDYRAAYPGDDPKSYERFDYAGYNGWLTKDTVRVAKYYWLEKEAFTATNPNTGEEVTRYRKRCYVALLAGDEIKHKTELLFSGDAYIPVVPVYGLDVTIDGKRYLEGLVRNAIDPQRMLNYAKSASAEHVSLVNKAPWIGTPEQFENHPEWDDTNTPQAKLVYNAADHNGVNLPPPQRTQGPTANNAWIQIEQQAILDMQAAMGIYEASLASNPNQQSGRALLSLQRQASQGTFHFTDNLARSLRHLGRILVSMVPRYYDAKRVARIIGEDGAQEMAHLDQSMPTAYMEGEDMMGNIQKIYNLGVGRYDVISDVGPSFATKRQEATESSLELVRSYPRTMDLAGDIVVSQMDWPMSSEMSERFKKAIPPQLLGDDQKQSPELMQAQQQMEQMAQQMEEMSAAMQRLQSGADLEQSKMELERIKIEVERVKAENEAAKISTGAEEKPESESAQERLELDYLRKILDIERRILDAEKREATLSTLEQEGVKRELIDSKINGLDQAEEKMEKLAEAIQQLIQFMAQSTQKNHEHMQGVTMVLSQLSKPKRKIIEFDPKTGRPIGISEHEVSEL